MVPRNTVNTKPYRRRKQYRPRWMYCVTHSTIDGEQKKAKKRNEPEDASHHSTQHKARRSMSNRYIPTEREVPHARKKICDRRQNEIPTAGIIALFEPKLYSVRKYRNSLTLLVLLCPFGEKILII